MKLFNHLAFLLLVVFSGSSVAAQTAVKTKYTHAFVPRTSTIFYKIGETTVLVKLVQYGDVKDVVYINLHADETTSVNAAKRVLEQQGGYMIRIENNNKRNIKFRLKGRYYMFDPNRMFSREGAAQTLSQLGRTNTEAVNEVAQFGERILQLFPANPDFVIALHNNTEGKFGIDSYLRGAPRETDAKDVYADSLQDADDIFLTTDSALYKKLSAEKYNTILQDNERARKDGSLSIYCGERNISYLNCETQHGKEQQYYKMLLSAAEHIEWLITTPNSFKASLQPEDPATVNTELFVYFGDKRIGTLHSLVVDSNMSISGQLDIDKRFAIYTNMDLFLLQSADGSMKIDVRVDPTREKTPVRSADEIIAIKSVK